MAGIESFLKKVCVQPAVYWGNPVPDGMGGCTFAAPVEIKVRWASKVSTPHSTYNKSEQVDSRTEVTKDATEVLCTQDLDIGGFLWLGSLQELTDFLYPTPAHTRSPLFIDNAMKITNFSKTPLLFSKTKFVRTAML